MKLTTLLTLTLTLTLTLLLGATGELPTEPTLLSEYHCLPDATTSNFTATSPYAANLNHVLSALISSASTSHSLSTSSGAGTTSAAYGLYYCRADIPAQLCSACVTASVRIASPGGDCYPVTEGVIYFFECTLEYADVSKVGLIEDSKWSVSYSYNNVTDSDAFDVALGAHMKSLISTAAYGNTSAGFATGKDVVSEFVTLYGLVQCRPDINGSLCEGCLQSVFRLVKSSYTPSERVTAFVPGCQLRYALSPFYFTNAPPPEQAPSVDSPQHGISPYIIAIPVAVVLVLLLLGGGCWFCLHKKPIPTPTPTEGAKPPPPVLYDPVPANGREEQDIGNVDCFDFRAMELATDNFSDKRKLGTGGFGSVYKGILPNGQLVAVKRLANSNDHHIREFKTEVGVVAKLQHRNLVRLVGFSAENEERIIVYEYLPNLSLDQFLFDATKSVLLDWTTRFKIIEGIAWGLRYLHVDSLLTIVHRDLKSSNILLDKEMNPKIADFGLARLVNVNETTVNVTAIAGTMGYMAPEYAISGRCTVKSDIYSFGVIILEVLSGKNVGKFYDPTTNDGLLPFALRVWKQRTIEELMDPTLKNYSRIEAERLLQIGLLCVEDNEDSRPPIRALLSMLENHSIELPSPTPSTFYRSNRPPVANMAPPHQASEFTQTGEYQVSTSAPFRKDPYPR